MLAEAEGMAVAACWLLGHQAIPEIAICIIFTTMRPIHIKWNGSGWHRIDCDDAAQESEESGKSDGV